MSKKILYTTLIVSLLFNIALFLLFKKRSADMDYLHSVRARIESIRKQESEIFAGLLIGHLTKEDLLARLGESSKGINVFEKPQENGVGAETIFFTFEKDNQLTKVDVIDTSEK